MSSQAKDFHRIDLHRLMTLRLVVGRVGELGLCGWWGTKDVLGPMGAMAYTRGFPRSHFWAQARVVFEVARARCRERFPDPSAITLWDLPASVEDQLEHAWGQWLGEKKTWPPFFERLKEWKSPHLEEALKAFGLWEEGMGAFLAGALPAGAGVEVPALDGFSDRNVGLLAAGFAKGGAGELLVPFLRLGMS